jgi:hypothetical protein
MRGNGIRDAGGATRPLDVDDQPMWDGARRAPLSATALDRIAARVKSPPPKRAFGWTSLGLGGSGPRWHVWTAAALLLLVGGAATATFLIRRPDAEGIREERARATPLTVPAAVRDERSPEAPAVAATPATKSAAAAAAQMSPAQPAPVEPPTRTAIAPRRKAAPVQLALRAPAAATRTMAPSPSPSLPSSAAPSPSQSPSPSATTAAPSLAPTPVAEPPSRNGASAEAEILRAALTALHHDNDPTAALGLLDQYDARFPRGTLRGEATLARAHSLRELGRDDELLRLLERVSFADLPRAAELRVLRGELRLTRHRFADALVDFDAALVAGAPDALVERALFGRASGRSHLGDAEGARADLRRYLERFPTAPRAAEVRARLAP